MALRSDVVFEVDDEGRTRSLAVRYVVAEADASDTDGVQLRACIGAAAAAVAGRVIGSQATF
jgi:hypothetical protein